MVKTPSLNELRRLAYRACKDYLICPRAGMISPMIVVAVLEGRCEPQGTSYELKGHPDVK